MNYQSFQQFSKTEQMRMITTELRRAVRWQDNEPGLYDEALQRCLNVVSFMKKDPKWNSLEHIVGALERELTAYRERSRSDSIERLYKAIWSGVDYSYICGNNQQLTKNGRNKKMCSM
jgi:hypothetical protein